MSTLHIIRNHASYGHTVEVIGFSQHALGWSIPESSLFYASSFRSVIVAPLLLKSTLQHRKILVPLLEDTGSASLLYCTTSTVIYLTLQSADYPYCSTQQHPLKGHQRSVCTFAPPQSKKTLTVAAANLFVSTWQWAWRSPDKNQGAVSKNGRK